MKTITVFAHLGQVTAIAFPGEAQNFNGTAVHSLEITEGDSIADKLTEAGIPGGVGSPWPPLKPEGDAKPVKPKK